MARTLIWATQTGLSSESSAKQHTPPVSTFTKGELLYAVFIFSSATYLRHVAPTGGQVSRAFKGKYEHEEGIF